MLDARASQYGRTPAEMMGLDASSPDAVEAWAALLVNEACYLAGGRREAEEADQDRTSKAWIFNVRQRPLRR